MINNSNKEKDFFISYADKDENWAAWIAETLESKGYSTIIQVWDFKAGGSFVNDIDEAIKKCRKVILVLSERYLESEYCKAEWQNFFVNDPVGKNVLIIPVRIDNVKPEGLLASRTYLDLHGITDEVEAVKLLIEKIGSNTGARVSPGFPGARAKFPGELPLNNLPNRNTYFTGRESILKSIESAFKQKKGVFLTQAISGLGGIGKTQIAIEYAYKYANQYNCIWLINAETQETLLGDLLKFVENKCGVDFEEATPDIVIEAVRNWTAGNSGWLFIFDNAEDYSMIVKYLPRNNAGQGNVLITSRNEFWDKTGSKAFKVDIYNEEEAVQFLQNRTGIKNDNVNAKDLNEVLGGLPLALEHAAAYISENDITFAKYIEMFNNYKIKLLEQGLTKDEASIASTWRASIDKIGIEAALQLLYICSYYAPEKIHLDTLILGDEYLMQPLKNVVADELELNSIIHELRRYSLISITDRNLSIHRLLQESVRRNVEYCAEYIECCFNHINKLMQDSNFITKEGRDTARLLLPHALSVVNNIEGLDLQLDDIHTLCFNIAYSFSEFAIYTESVRFYQKALAISEKVFGKEHPSTATTYNNIALVYARQGDYPKALEWYQKALAISEKVLGKEHPDTATTYNNIAVVYDSQGDYPKALEWYQKALTIFECKLGSEHPYTKMVKENIDALGQ
jgi:tetratricopeptide (TPR) repeat protein